ncbi:MAG: YebC/PmpR family DNA-binding transcriptional regulator [Chloroflexi bacterium]|nr:YebC/PmpR family DNA-binding transcriptional regulator [Chloroflexota bacterium]MCL5952851.1 YebC/PmpR family DNA-binding transcriptional regulator [Chloroflexota bacterium]
MSGHSKWAQIKRKKGVADVKKGAMFTRLGREIAIAAREGGGDPNANFALRLAVDKARASNMPKDNIERAIKRGTGELSEGGALEEVMYEGYGPGSTALLVQVLTDNRNRAASELRHIFTRSGGNMASSNAVAWMFEKKGVVTLEAGKTDPDELALQVIDAGADDVKVDGNLVEAYVAPEQLKSLREELEKRHIPFTSAELAWIAKTPAEVSDEAAIQTMKLMEAIEELDDVQKVHTNLDISDEVMAKYEGAREHA